MDRWNGKVAIVTDACGGIGLKITEMLMELGMKVVGLAVDAKQMENLSKKFTSSNFYTHKMDITKEDEIKDAFKWSFEEVGPVSILVNTGGVVLNSKLIGEPTSTDAWKKMWGAVVLGIAIATREAIDIMKNNDIPGHIVHMNTGQGHAVICVPNTTFYGPESIEITNLTQQIRTEFNTNKKEINVTSIRPNVVVSNFGPNGDHNLEYSLFDPATVAKAIIYAISTPSHIQVCDLSVYPMVKEL